MFDKMTREIQHYYKIIEELHGKVTAQEIAVDIIADDLGISKEFIIERLNKPVIDKDYVPKEYGLLIARLQPFHAGHQYIINKILLDGKTPLILLGIGKENDERNPLTVEQRIELVKLVYPTECIFERIWDKDDWNEWFDDVGYTVIGSSGRHKEQITLYTHRKEQDQCDFVHKGKQYLNASYPALFEDAGIKIEDLDLMTCILNREIHGTEIRKDENIARDHLDARVYLKLKEWGWWS